MAGRQVGRCEVGYSRSARGQVRRQAQGGVGGRCGQGVLPPFFFARFFRASVLRPDHIHNR